MMSMAGAVGLFATGIPIFGCGWLGFRGFFGSEHRMAFLVLAAMGFCLYLVGLSFLLDAAL